MTDLIEYIKFIGESYGIIDPDFIFNVSKFLVSNNWFGCLPITDNNQLLLEDDLAEKIGTNVAMYCELYDTDEDGKTKYLIKRIADFMPKTSELLSKYIKAVKLNAEAAHHLADFILSFLPGEIDESTDSEIAALMDNGFDELPKVYGDILADFINWAHKHTKTVYKSVYYVSVKANGDLP